MAVDNRRGVEKRRGREEECIGHGYVYYVKCHHHTSKYYRLGTLCGYDKSSNINLGRGGFDDDLQFLYSMLVLRIAR